MSGANNLHGSISFSSYLCGIKNNPLFAPRAHHSHLSSLRCGSRSISLCTRSIHALSNARSRSSFSWIISRDIALRHLKQKTSPRLYNAHRTDARCGISYRLPRALHHWLHTRLSVADAQTSQRASVDVVYRRRCDVGAWRVINNNGALDNNDGIEQSASDNSSIRIARKRGIAYRRRSTDARWWRRRGSVAASTMAISANNHQNGVA